MEGFVNKLTGGEKKESAHSSRPQGDSYEHEAKQQSSGGFMDKINTAAGGGRESEKNEDGLDKGVDWVQEHVLGQGDQSNESAIEQAKDEQISDYIRGQFKKTTGHEVPIKDKERF